jgi:hypothetical protein
MLTFWRNILLSFLHRKCLGWGTSHVMHVSKCGPTSGVLIGAVSAHSQFTNSGDFGWTLASLSPMGLGGPCMPVFIARLNLHPTQLFIEDGASVFL